MTHRCLASTAAVAGTAAVVWLAAVSVAGQAPATAAGSTYAAPRTPWGHPDLQGVWNNGVSTPLERPLSLGTKATWTDAELADYTQRARLSRENRDRRDQKPGSVTDVGRAYNALWFPVPGDPIRRTSLVVDPANGRVPPLTAEGEKRFLAYAATLGRFGTSASPAGREDLEDGTEGGVDGRGTRGDNPEDRRLSERCLVFGGVPRLPGGYNNHLQIVQSPGFVVIEMEQIHDARIIPLDGRPHLPPSIRHWMGDSRGRWEGDTLVVDVTNFTDKAPFRGSFENLHLVERFTRTNANTINYELTVDDPSTFTKPWKAEFPWTKLEALVGGVDEVQRPRMYEYACHEGNYGLEGQLRGTRAEDKSKGSAKR
ncbi:MAG: hypothetical protein GEU82_17015 [Luteitalea sp.]|nr:hypothetical protein [Luteitalea sp.]